ncbi:MAG: hypothetical protein ACC628_00525 [Pirellulaceae bacterium]
MITTTTRQTSNEVDFDLHKLVGIRVENGSASDIAAVRRQLGPLETSLAREPDITVRFVDHLPLDKSLRYLGAYEAGVTEDAFWILRGKHKSKTRVKIPVEQISEKHCEVVCETGLEAVPLLIAIINLTALKNGAVPLHASAFNYNGTGVLSTGWSKGGKTETLLSFMANGAQYIADEWVYLHGDGRMSGIPEPIRVWDWHLDTLPQYRSCASRGALARLRTIKWMQASLHCIPGGKWLPGRVRSRLAPFLKQQLFVDVPAERLFGREHMRLVGELHKVLFVISHASPAIRIEPMDPEEIAQRMVHSLQFEQFPFLGFYRMFRFAFPDLANDLIDRTEELQGELLRTALAGKDAYSVSHPYPVSLPSMFEAISPLCRPSEPPPRPSAQPATANGGCQP